MSLLPKVHPDIFSSIIVEMDGPQKDPNWPGTMFTELNINNPVLADYLLKVSADLGEKATLVGLIVCRIIESQLEADALTELYSEEKE